MAEQPRISIVIVTYNSKTDLERCLPTLRRVELPVEILVVDNASSDGTVEWLQQNHPDVRVVALEQNTWYAGGNNIGIAAATGAYILVLNPDTEIETGAIAEMVRVAEEYPRALVTAKLLLPDGTVNACGNLMQYTGIVKCLGLHESPDTFHGVLHPLLLSGAAILARKEIWDHLGGFDETYQMYVEDTDLSLRARLLGYEIVCAADAVIKHHYTLGMSPRKFRFLERNRLVTIFKTFETGTLLRLVPALVLTSIATGAFALVKGNPYRSAWIDAYRDLWASRTHVQSARAQLQTERAVADRALLGKMIAPLPFDQLLDNAMVAQVLSAVTTPVFRVLKPGRGEEPTPEHKKGEPVGSPLP